MFPKIGVPQNGWFIMENTIKIHDLGVPLFVETSISSGGFLLHQSYWMLSSSTFSVCKKLEASHHQKMCSKKTNVNCFSAEKGKQTNKQTNTRKQIETKKQRNKQKKTKKQTKENKETSKQTNKQTNKRNKQKKQNNPNRPHTHTFSMPGFQCIHFLWTWTSQCSKPRQIGKWMDWWFQPTHLMNMLVKLDQFPK